GITHPHTLSLHDALPISTSTASSCGTNSCDTTPKTASCGADRKTTVSASSECCDSQPTVTVKKEGKYSGVWREAWSEFIDVLPYLLIGIDRKSTRLNSSH